MTAYTADDHRHMQQALRLAELSTRRASPNPGVGCVLVRDGQVIGEGATLPAGQDHAEIQAIKNCLARGLSPQGATAYVTLEPCSHYGRTPPCAERLVKEGVARVVVALVDPSPQVAGQGLAKLQAAGISASAGLMAEQARWLHRGFLSRIERQRPWVVLKAAASLDGKTALLNGKSQWITGPAARRDVHLLRAQQDAILTGSGTVMADNPQLTVREVPCERQPLRVVLDRQLHTAPSSRIYQSAPSLLYTAMGDPARHLPYQQAGAQLELVAEQDGHLDLRLLLQSLALRGMNHLMLEAGAGLNGAMLQAGLVDELVLYLAPCLLGDAARGLFAWPALEDLTQKQSVVWRDVRMVGQDVRLQAVVKSA